MAIRTRTGRRHPALVPATLAVLTACLVVPSTAASADTGPQIVEQVGAAMVTDGINFWADEFAVDSQGRMWEFEQSGSDWSKADRGYPSRDSSSTTIVEGAGAVGVNHGVRAYAIGADGNLWEFSHDGDATSWAKFPRPDGAGRIVDAVGADTTEYGMPVVVVLDDARQLWQYRYDGTRWGTESLGTVPADAGQLRTVAGMGKFNGGAYAFAISNRNELWSVHKTRNGRWTWFSWGTHPEGRSFSSLGVTWGNGGLLHAFVRAGDGHAWRVSWDDPRQTGRWDDLGAPPAVPLTGNGGGVAQFGSVEQITALGNDGRLWSTMTGQGPTNIWSKAAVPAGFPSLNKELGSRTVEGDLHTFAVDAEKDLWVATYSYNRNLWAWKEISE
ncbi:hypothetical protein Sipo8835_22290 [Streptomyces ipomoeae]|uniref:Uncharacterized protein n=2 Tax=Streptomyces ipomoeae TaxID=103232 RepID=A0AAE8W0E3_9ACTN|nr:hypothetical protein [Streptomyces ipomoeae]EKX65929.1 putative lipoprotein [Streptomyces ipomoeae 91-03]MDX2693905.1 hypothetical protein [Streptomyces ipomoeae]MDX2821982.1 hypothetical protein [Streptomyces ipomoeae]MDX2839805.1 hypothetical protein [Streptomyces ipomoeae]MDX2873816.1 hypothetical protein [Streptomyces ipomoeae]